MGLVTVLACLLLDFAGWILVVIMISKELIEMCANSSISYDWWHLDFKTYFKDWMNKGYDFTFLTSFNGR